MLATTIHESNTTPHHQAGRQQPHPVTRAPLHEEAITTPGSPERAKRRCGLVVSKPNSVFDEISCRPAPPKRAPPEKPAVCCAPEPHPTTGCGPSNESPESPNSHNLWAGSSLVVLLRKEVIQPHLPVRLPCYDFVPIADPTFDGSLPYGLGHRLRVLPTFMT